MCWTGRAPQWQGNSNRATPCRRKPGMTNANLPVRAQCGRLMDHAGPTNARTRGGRSMNVAIQTRTRLEVVPLTQHIGAEVRGIDLRQRPDDATIKAIYQAWLDHLVLI